jgi:hypothetical protein
VPPGCVLSCKVDAAGTSSRGNSPIAGLFFQNKVYRENPADTIAKIHSVGLREVLHGKYRFACISACFQDSFAARSRQETACNRGCSPNSVLNEKHVVYRALGQLASFIEE